MEILFDNFTWFLLLLTRVAAIVGASPLLGSRNVPMQLKAALAAIIAIVLLQTIDVPAAAPPEGLSILPLLLKEVAAGLLLGYSITVTFAIFQLMGQFMDFPMGFSMVNVFDPTSQTQIPILGQFNYLLALMIFLLIDGHHFLFYVLKKSLELVPLGAVALPRELLGWLLAVFSQMFSLGFQLSLPVVGTLFLTDLALAILARTVPQMNVFVVGYPAKVAIGLGVLLLTLPLYGGAFVELFSQRGWLAGQLEQLLLLFGR